MVGVAVNVTLVPVQMELPEALDAMLTLAVKLAFTVMVIPLEVAGEPVTQFALEVICTVTICPLVNEVVVYVALFVPKLVPFTFH